MTVPQIIRSHNLQNLNISARKCNEKTVPIRGHKIFFHGGERGERGGGGIGNHTYILRILSGAYYEYHNLEQDTGYI